MSVHVHKYRAFCRPPGTKGGGGEWRAGVQPGRGGDGLEMESHFILVPFSDQAST